MRYFIFPFFLTKINVEPPQHIKKQNGIVRDLKEKVDAADITATDANSKFREEQLAESDVCFPFCI